MPLQQLIILTGMSGSGKHTLFKAFEDLGYYCVDNLPVQLVPHLVRLAEGREASFTHLAIVVDVREGQFLEGFQKLHEQLQRSTFQTRIIFLEASDKVLVKRFSETRRPHPLADDKPILQAIRRERRQLQRLKELADVVIDTSEMTVHSARAHVLEHFKVGGQEKGMVTTLVSFGFKYGIPFNADLVFDVRYLPNPFFVKRLNAKTGEDAAVIAYLRRFPETLEILRRLTDLLLFLHPRFKREGKSYLTVAVGCTGGKHRSVMVANALAEELSRQNLRVAVMHRDITKDLGGELREAAR